MFHARTISRALGYSAVAVTFALTLYGCPTTPPQNNVNPSTGGEKGLVIEINPAGTNPNPNPFKAHLFKGSDPATKGQDHVRWHNAAGVQVTLHFTAGFPFMGSTQDIVIQPGEYSAWYTLDLSKPNTGYSYHIDPIPTDPGGGPGDPTISDDP